MKTECNEAFRRLDLNDESHITHHALEDDLSDRGAEQSQNRGR